VELTPEEVRVVGCLVEKQLTTPQQYPLTLNALLGACNQSSNRSPITFYDERTVASAVASLKEKGLVRFVHPSHGRSVTRYKHVLDEALTLDPRQLVLLAALMLRGPQTAGELRGRTERMAQFRDVEEIDETLKDLGEADEPLVMRLSREPGRREARYAHLLTGEPEAAVLAPEPSPPPGVLAGAGTGGASMAGAGTGGESTAAGPAARPDGAIADELIALRKEVAALGRALDHILARLTR
jgi:uncharacterized protein YceH (UPF0502 family)